MLGSSFVASTVGRSAKKKHPEKKITWNKGVPPNVKADHARAAKHYERAAQRNPDDPYALVRLLSVYHASDRSAEAFELISKLNGQSFPEKHVEELEHLILQYQKASFEKSESQSRVTLD